MNIKLRNAVHWMLFPRMNRVYRREHSIGGSPSSLWKYVWLKKSSTYPYSTWRWFWGHIVFYLRVWLEAVIFHVE